MSDLQLPWGVGLFMHGGRDDTGRPLPPFEMMMCPRCVAMVVKEHCAHHEAWHRNAVGEAIP